MKVYRFNDHEGAGGLIVKNPESLVEELRAAEPGDGPYYIFVEEMEEEAVDSLGEWDGF